MTQKLLKKKLSYCQETGIFLWKISAGNRIKNSIAGNMNSNGYIHIYINKKCYKAHRLAFLYIFGYSPKCVDHINHHTADNRISNLRDVSHQENHRNRALSQKNSSGVTGVHFDKKKKRWIAQIQFDKKVHLGTFIEFSDAVNARKNAEVLYGFHENHGKD